MTTRSRVFSLLQEWRSKGLIQRGALSRDALDKLEEMVTAEINGQVADALADWAETLETDPAPRVGYWAGKLREAAGYWRREG